MDPNRMTAADYLAEGAATYGNRCCVAIGFAIDCDDDTEAHYAYLNARWAARLANSLLAEDCAGCDGYVLNPSEAPYCPSCARERAK